MMMGNAPGAATGDVLDGFVDRFFDQYYFRYAPTAATAAGIHRYDDSLEDYSRAGVEQRVKLLRLFEREGESLPPTGLTISQQGDREFLLSHIRSELLELEQIRSWEKNPDLYSSGVTSSVFVIMSRTFASPETRLRSVVAREKQMSAVFAAAKQNLVNPPQIYTQIAIEQLPGIVSFFEKDVPAAFSKVTDQTLLDEFRGENQHVMAALQDYEQWLKEDLLPRSQGDFRIGGDNYRRKLLYDEMVDVPLDRLLEIGYENLRANQQAFRAAARKLDPKKSPEQILHELERDHPAPDNLLQSFRDTLSGLQRFIRTKHIATIPSPVLPTLEETPPFMRATTFASMDTPGAYETVAKEAFFNVTLPEKSWSAQQTEEHMAAFNRGVIEATAIHEAYPGHYVQFLWVQKAPSRVRKLLAVNSNAEGWAHYCEQMMLDEGYGGGDLKLRLGQLQDALLRNARYIAGIQMHTGKMTYNQALDFFVKEGYQTKSNAERETKRGTSDPTYLVYTLGKLQIYKLRADYQKLKGSQFNLKEFHDRFLREGAPPVKLVRRALLGDNSPVL